jgi:hypothetical protein
MPALGVSAYDEFMERLDAHRRRVAGGNRVTKDQGRELRQLYEEVQREREYEWSELRGPLIVPVDSGQLPGHMPDFRSLPSWPTIEIELGLGAEEVEASARPKRGSPGKPLEPETIARIEELVRKRLEAKDRGEKALSQKAIAVNAGGKDAGVTEYRVRLVEEQMVRGRKPREKSP